ncbi:MAG TPA: DUF3040 domain-containing protein [Flexivirga sp.]|uniref:DUF3040 domain-containing protein n=1 Tax=Flexivirga sp. TaxID=1962927 RepID=UPI002C6E494E|nr:DUF3040 domain-containing protein [Flexivirga sp.]HWC21088.1 DUF3040 domain-containing protein [Flexivirga sp.]
MALTPHEEREIHQIEESLLGSDPGFVARMNRTWRPHRRLLLPALCLVAATVAFGLFGPAGWTLPCVAVGAFLAGVCLGRVDGLDLRLLVRRVLAVPGRVARGLCRLVARPLRHHRRHRSA